MVTLQTADNALKTFYLDAVSEQIDKKISPFFSKIEKTSAHVSGKGVSKTVRVGLSGGIAAGTETGDLPNATQGDYLNFTAPLKNIYGTIEITDKALRASANNENAFVNLLNDEMQSLIKSAKYNFSRMLFGDGTGKIANFVDVVDNIVTLDTVKGLEEGMYVDFYLDGECVYPHRKILAVDRMSYQITMDRTNWSDSSLEMGVYVVLSGGTLNCELTGLAALFSEKDIYGVSRERGYMRPYVSEDFGDMTQAGLQKAIDDVEEIGGSKVNLILCTRAVRRALIENCRDNPAAISMTTIGDDTSVMTFNGIPVVVDDFCPDRTMYLLNTDHFKLCQLCDWQWMEGEDGKVLKQIAGKPVYTATLVKYAELICEKPCAQGMLIGIDEV